MQKAAIEGSVKLAKAWAGKNKVLHVSNVRFLSTSARDFASARFEPLKPGGFPESLNGISKFRTFQQIREASRRFLLETKVKMRLGWQFL